MRYRVDSIAVPLFTNSISSWDEGLVRYRELTNTSMDTNQFSIERRKDVILGKVEWWYLVRERVRTNRYTCRNNKSLLSVMISIKWYWGWKLLYDYMNIKKCECTKGSFLKKETIVNSFQTVYKISNRWKCPKMAIENHCKYNHYSLFTVCQKKLPSSLCYWIKE